VSALGRALLDFWGGDPRKKSYQATGWHAQVRKLSEHSRGSWAADQAGLDVSHSTLVRWLAEQQHPSSENQAKIHQAYSLLAGGIWDPAAERRLYEITGWVQTGQGTNMDLRFRGIPSGPDKSAPLRIDGTEGRWDRIREAYEDGSIDEQKAEEWFTEDVIDQDIGDGSGGGWEFPGASYSV
jgi:hypothetical protein